MDKSGEEYQLTTERFTNVLGIPSYRPPEGSLDDRYQKVMGKQQEYMHEDRRRQKDVFSFTIFQNIPRWSYEYYSSAGYPEDRRLSDLLYTCRMRSGTITVTKYSSTGKMQYCPLTEKKVEKIFEDFGIPYHENAAYQLLAKMKCLQKQCLEGQWNKALDELRSSGEQGVKAANWLKTNWESFSLHDGYLIYHQPYVHTISSYAAYSATLAVSWFKQTHGLKPSQCKSIFRALTCRLKLQENLLKEPEESCLTWAENGDCVAVFSNIKNIYCVRFDKDKGKFALEPANYAPEHSLKTIPLTELSPLTQSSEELLATITGRNLDAANQLARLFADIADPRNGQRRVSVVLTRHNKDIVRRLLYETFHKEGGLKVMSINKVLSKNGKAELLEQQIRGEALVLLNDTLPSDTYLTEFAAATKGKLIKIKDNVLGVQSFKNHLHFVYVTDRPLVASTLSKQHNATVIDLSEWEHPYTTGKSVLLSDLDRNWFRSAFVLQGCYAKYLMKRDRGSRRHSDLATKDVAAFFHACCKVSHSSVCEHNELYQAYCKYYQGIHGCLPPESSIIFTRHMKQICPSSVEYKVKRYGENSATHLCYVGLKLCSEKGSLCSGQQNDASEFHRYLQGIEQSAKTLLPSLKTIKIQLSY